MNVPETKKPEEGIYVRTQIEEIGKNITHLCTQEGQDAPEALRQIVIWIGVQKGWLERLRELQEKDVNGK